MRKDLTSFEQGSGRDCRGNESKSQDHALDETIAFWQPLAERQLTREDARQIRENVTGFFRLLQQWQEAEEAGTTKSVPADSASKQAA